MWCCHMKSIKRKTTLIDNIQSHPSARRIKDYNWESEALGMCMNSLRTLLNHTSVWLYTLIVGIFLQLILSGDVESNPGPMG